MFERKRKQDQYVGRRRPLSTEQLRAAQNRAYSYHASRAEDPHNVGRIPSAVVEDRAHGKSRVRAVTKRVPVIILSIVILFFILDQFSLQSTPKVVVLGPSASNVFLQNTSVYQSAATKLFKGSQANHNKLTVNVSAITSSLKQQFPELEDVSVTLPVVGHQPIVYIEPSQPSFAFETTSGIYLLDQDGTALAQATNVQQVAAMHIQAIVDQSGPQPAIGKMVLPSTDISFIQTVVDELKARGIGISSIVLPPAASEVDVYISGHSFYGKFNMEEQNDALSQVGTFIAVYKQLASENKLPSQYIDVTVDGRAFYK